LESLNGAIMKNSILMMLFISLISCGGFGEGTSGGATSSPFFTQLGATTTAVGGSNTGADLCSAVAVDSNQDVYCAGSTSGAMGETNGGGGNDAFIMKLNSSGTLQWVTQLGATTTAVGGSNSGGDECRSIAVDSSDNVYCAGYTGGAMG
jgi:hypothetical protein